ncbi:hypothetical protein QR680_014723 [Steinernema hermaphroditum]|uniref:DUF19 domain-containing protein n=1 Tax=Steinernema hermaphroditum TaxID=289476 RepID=A0AA39M4R6_9BILA|nr:hypothetical protein QR680_014723 [Steinernema hermaphroditum]
MIVRLTVLLAAITLAESKDTCYGKILKLCKSDKFINSEVNLLLATKEFDKLQAITFEKVKEHCGDGQRLEIQNDFERNSETVAMIKELLGHLSAEERLRIKEMTVEENRLGVYGFFVAKAMDFFTNPQVASLIWKIAPRLPQLTIPRTSF